MVTSDDSSEDYESPGIYFFAASVTCILFVETLVWFISRWGIRQFLQLTQNRIVESLSTTQTALSLVEINELTQLGSRFVVLLVMTVLSLTLILFLLILRWWVFSPIEYILARNKTEEGGRPEIIEDEKIPHNEVGQLMRSRNDMLTAIDQIFSEEAIETLVQAVDAKDPYTRGHSRRVGAFGSSIGRQLGLKQDRIAKLNYSGTLHDLGKIGIDDSILTKPDSLTDEEFEIIKSHPEKGIDIVQVRQFDDQILAGINYHHESYDGSGYPEGLEGDEIPEFGRILAVADAVDAMLSDRAYRDALSREIVLEELEKNKGSQFDPDPADAALTLLKDEDPDKIPEHYIEKMNED
ncbi:MAG: HD-GYP domain-containing protein [bacterium]